MKKLSRTALTLTKETIRSLSEAGAGLVVGGRRPIESDTCNVTIVGCNPPPVTWTCTDTYHCL
jgi:hypothetical protein